MVFDIKKLLAKYAATRQGALIYITLIIMKEDHLK